MGSEHDSKVIRYAAEGSFNSGAGGNKQTVLNVISYEAEPIPGKTENKEIDSTKQKGAPSLTNLMYRVKLSCYLKYGELDAFFAAAFRDSAWSTPVDVTDNVYSTAAADNSINDSGSGFVSDGYVAKQLLRTKGFTLASGNGISKISTVAVGKMELLGIDVADEIAGDSVTVEMGAQIVNGVNLSSFAFEEEIQDIATTFIETRGCYLETLSIASNANDDVIVDMTFIGAGQDIDAATNGDGAPTAASTNPRFKFSNVNTVFENLTGISVANNLRFTFNTGLRPNDFTLGTLGISEMNSGDFVATAEFQYILASTTIQAKLAAMTESSLIAYFEDSAGNGYGFEIVAFTYDSISNSNSGKSNDYIKSATLTGHKHSTEAITARMARFPV